MIVPEHWKERVLGSTLTSIKIGGPVLYVSRPQTTKLLAADITRARRENLPYRFLGGGSNLVLPDAGFQGVLIRPVANACTVLSPAEAEPYITVEPVQLENRYKVEGEGYLQLEDATRAGNNYIYVELEAGVPWGQAVLWSLKQNLVGLHWFARIPCTVGGAVYNNIHGESHFLSEFMVGVRGLNTTYQPAELALGYDTSIFHTNGDIIHSVILRLPKVGEKEAAQAQKQYLQWTQAKNTIQPTEPNCGSVFQNITLAEAAKQGETALAAAYYIDQKCGLKGEREGGLQVSPHHGNFIINTGGGTQVEFITLVERIRERVRAVCGIGLQPEVECMTETGEKHAWK